MQISQASIVNLPEAPARTVLPLWDSACNFTWLTLCYFFLSAPSFQWHLKLILTWTTVVAASLTARGNGWLLNVEFIHTISLRVVCIHVCVYSCVCSVLIKQSRPGFIDNREDNVTIMTGHNVKYMWKHTPLQLQPWRCQGAVHPQSLGAITACACVSDCMHLYYLKPFQCWARALH